ncbi:regulator of microtubule dynamics protein 1 [Exaiptasia diaphana]|uniref:Regulator of microtubule dynamics protein 1 n=1 Tax=Exaiptasia diaphana TaxID=2652724 RepID=A0A913XD98_EXADI|nr:regulator of microtubule dynamics protein 1 [Exaiptasia diaphana]
MSDEELAIVESDKLFDDNEIDKLYDLLMKFCESNNPEIVWRLARAARNKAEKSVNEEDKKTLTYKGYEFAKKAVELDDKNFACHKWLGIMLSNVGDFEATKVKIQNAYKIKEHFEKSIELSPNDPTCRYLLGVWCFTVANMPWYQRKVAAALFATPPSSSFEEALDHFEKAEALEPNFFSKNHLMLGKTYYSLKKYEEAKVWLLKATNHPEITTDDIEANKQAEELLKYL